MTRSISSKNNSVSNPKNKQGALVMNSENPHQFEMIDGLFPDGYTSKTVSDLTELRDALNQLIPPEQPKHQPDNNVATMDETKRFELFRSAIEHEDDLLNNRVSWIILAQSFLMAAYITSDLNSLRFVTAMVGLMTVVVTLPAILAAGSNIEVQQQVYFRQISSDERCRILHGHDRDLSTKPVSEEMKKRLKEGHVLPNMAFRSSRSVKILTTALMLGFVQVAGWIFLLVAVVKDWEIIFS